jgi:hypothetical protein
VKELEGFIKTVIKNPYLLGIILVGLFFYIRNYRGHGDFWFGLKPFDTVADLIESWDPKRCSTHSEYQNSLSNYLRDNLNGPRVTKEYKIERTAIDIVVGDKVAIEIKVGFNRTTEFHRLKGQLEDYAREFSRIVIVLCGELDDDLVDKLEDTLPEDTKIRIIEK